MHKVITCIIIIFFSFPALAQPVTIAALGDSLTQGYGLRAEDGFVPQLQKWVQKQGVDVQIINAGVSGDTTAGGLARVEWTLTPEVAGMIVTLGGNDLLRGIDPATSRANLQGILEAARKADIKVLLIGMPVPNNFGPDYKTRFEAIYPELAAEFDTLYLDNFFTGFGDARNTPAALNALMQPDNIHPNATGVLQIVEAVGPKVLELVALIDK